MLAKSAYWKMNPVVIEVDRVQRVGAVAPVVLRVVRAGAVRLRVVVPTPAHRQVLRGVQVRCHLAGEDVLAVRHCEDAIKVREKALRVHRLQRVLLRALRREEEVRLVLRDRAAEAAAELIEAVILLLDVVQAFGLGLRVHREIAEQIE